MFEGYCDEQGAGQTMSKDCPNGCKDGACIVEVDKEKAVCIDSDGGKNYSVAGSVNWSNSSGSGILSDYCPSRPGDNQVREHYCSNNEVSIVFYDCPNGCKDGACIKDIEKPVCTDSDDGKNFVEKGTTTNTQFGTWTDTCLKDRQKALPGQENILFEGYCDEQGAGQTMSQDCPNGCKDGACIKVDSCPDVSVRERGKFCSRNRKLELQLVDGSFCENNWECKSNLCINNNCIVLKI